MGFAYTDGSYYEQSRNRGRYQFELHIRDVDILQKLQCYIPCHSSINTRQRVTNFKEIHTATLSFFQQEFREEIKRYVDNLTDYIKNNKISRQVFLRAVFEADGSLGFLADGRPFISMCIVEEELKEIFLDLTYSITDKKRVATRNARDNVYNIMFYSEDAQNILTYLYCGSTLFIDRKYDEYLKILKWKRDPSVKRIKSKSWSLEDDIFILNYSIEESMRKLNRTKKSIKTRLYRLKNKIN